jgi:hypothetical protein
VVNAYRRLGDAHILTLNTCSMDPRYPDSRDWRNVAGRVPDRDMAWLAKTLEDIQDRDSPLLVFVHIPFFSTYPDRMNAGQAEREVWLVGNRDQVVGLLKPFSNCTIFQGHLHENEHLEVEGIRFVSVGAIAGAWWSRQGFAECPDGAPRGYLIADVERKDVMLRYQSAGCLPGYQAGLFIHEGRRYLNIFFGDGREEVRLRGEDGWQLLQRAQGLVVRGRWTSAHLWEIPEEWGERPVTVQTALWGRGLRLEEVPLIEDYMRDEEDRKR